MWWIGSVPFGTFERGPLDAEAYDVRDSHVIDLGVHNRVNDSGKKADDHRYDREADGDRRAHAHFRALRSFG